jgi:hypothetical protein
MGLRKTIIVLVLAAIVGAYALYSGLTLVPVQTPKLLQIKADDITGITLRYPDREIVVSRDEKGNWKLVEPIKADADRSAVNGLTSSIAGCEIRRTVEGKASDLAPFGLDKPRVVLTVTVRGKNKLPGIEVGKTTPVGASVYMKTTDKPAVMLTASAFQAAMIKNADELRSHVLMAFNVGDVRSFTIGHLDGSEVEVDRKSGKWEIAKPASYPADQVAVQQLLDSLINAKIADFVTDKPADLSKYGLGTPHLAVRVLLDKNNRSDSLLFGFKDPDASKNAVYVRTGDGDSVYTVADSLLTDADKSANDLRDKTVLAFDPAKVDRVVVSVASKEFSLERAAGGKWNVIEDGKTSPADVPIVENFLDDARDLKGQKIVEDPMTDPKKYGMDQPTEQIALYGKGGVEIGAIKLAEFGRNVGSRKTSAGAMVLNTVFDYATSTTGKTVYTVAQYDLSQLRQTADQFRVKPAATPAPSPPASKK